MNLKLLRQCVDNLFSVRGTYMTLMQELAENFYPERADFTTKRTIGDNWAENLSTSYPIIVRRELGNQCGQMLRPTGKDWFHTVPTDPNRETNDAKRWLEYAEGIQRRAMYDIKARFEIAQSQADHDFSTFGAAVTSVRLNKMRNRLLFRCYHLRDVVWMEDEEDEICLVALRWKAKAHELKAMFPKTVSTKVVNLATKAPFTEVNCYHICVKADLYEAKNKGMGWFSIYYDFSHETLLEEVPYWRCFYDVARWQTVSGSQYPYSPAAVAALPEARLIQAMTYTLLEAGEKATNPPIIATDEVVKSTVDMLPGGITWVDPDYDERMGEALRPLTQDLQGFPVGKELLNDSRTILNHCFFLNKLNLPDRGTEMTAYEVGQRIQEYIRGAMPIFAPMEQERNGKTCESVFQLMLREGAFGPVQMMPASLQGADVQFQFVSPLHDIVEMQKGHKFLEAKELLRQALELDRRAGALLDVNVALREALGGVRTPPKWLRNEITVEQINEVQRAQEEAARTAQLAEPASKALANAAGAMRDVAQAA